MSAIKIVVSQPLKVMIMAGGTGGHVFPALAVATELRERGHDVQWLGTERGIEARLVPENNIPLHCIDVVGLRGKGFKALLKAPFGIFRAVRQAMAVLREQRPNVVLGLGGFASGPGGVAARLLRIPLVIHEQNAVAGTTNKMLAKIASRVMTAFPYTLPRGECCGNPVRAEISNLLAPAERLIRADSTPHLLVLGGSLGAVAINELIPEAMRRLPAEDRPKIWHQTGRDRALATSDVYSSFGIEAHVVPFIDDMAEAYGWADLVVCRAGALTVSELTAAGVAAIMVPYPYAIDDHQTRNADLLAAAHAGEVVQQRDLSPEKLAVMLQKLLPNRDELIAMAVRARDLSLPNAAQVVADACQEVCT
jgi:UDP-N-acetylglucosamine--N-acetylmuramyl-(pentapeptide) pyrophosphoryl-undecaprenol N-acetylglucosamine transferase